jgi:hypothetical protein
MNRLKSLFAAPLLLFGLSLCAAPPLVAQFLATPQPGDVFKEFTRVISTSNCNTCVTDPATTLATAQLNLPNDVLNITIDDLQDAVRAELVIDENIGHVGTTNKKIRFNGNAWINVPELGAGNGIPAGHNGQCYSQQFNPTLQIPLAHLIQGNNLFQGTSGPQTCYDFGWGLWAWYEVMVRVYYGPAKVHPTGSITSPTNGGTIGENPTVTASTSADAVQVDFLGYYDGYDADGDGVGQQYHYNYHRGKTETAVLMKGHIGSDVASPFSVVWNTALVPEQAAGSMKLLARIKGSNGVWFVTNEVTGLSLQRTGSYVRMYRAYDMPERFWVRAGAGRSPKSTHFTIPAGDNLANATSLKFIVSTMDADHVAERANYSMKVNSYILPYFGQDHWYSMDALTLPAGTLVQGTNTFTVASTTVHHGIEILWPGPALVVRYSGSPSNSAPSITLQPLNQSVNTGQTATFIVGAAGTAPLSYQWQKNTVNIGGATAASYTTPATVIGDNGATFRCVVTNLLGNATSNSATLTVTSGNLPPTVTGDPADQTVPSGTTAAFSVTATGTSPLAYQWQKNNANIGGALAASYTTPATVAADSGARFRCIVSNAFGIDTSASALLNVTTAPPARNVLLNPGFETGTSPWSFFTDGAGAFASVTPGFEGAKAGRVTITTAGTNVQLQQSNLVLEANTDYRLTFSAYSNTGHDLSVSLLKQVTPFTNYGLSSFVAPLTTGWQTFTRTFRTAGFTGVAIDGRLRFWFAPYDVAGDIFYIDNVLLQKVAATVPPSITAHPQSQSVTLGSTAAFSVTATGTLPFAYQWQKNNVNILGATSQTFITPATVLGDNGATFRCLVTNTGGTATSNSAVLTVLNGPPAGNWWNPAWLYRVRLDAATGSSSRTDKPAEVTLNFTQLLGAVGNSQPFDQNSLRLIEVTSTGTILDTAVAFQFDPDVAYDPNGNAVGDVVFLLSGSTPANSSRYFDVYFNPTGGTYAPPGVASQVHYTDDVLYQGTLSYQITTPTAVYYYHKPGGGFAGMFDIANNDWITWRVGGGSAGEYRGIPNTGAAFHPGYTNSNSLVLNSGPLKMTILSVSADNFWESTWEVYPRYARFTMRRAGGNYWFLYEGTPGGLLNPTTDFVYRSNGARNLANGSWSGDLSGAEWVYFGDRAMRRVLYMAHHESDTQSDSYRQMENNMTVFGFGRDNGPCCPQYLSGVPQHLTLGFAEDSLFSAASATINNAYLPVPVGVGVPQIKPVPLPAAPAFAGEDLPSEYALEQNFPNPFNPSTRINYQLPEPGTVILKVFDVLGREITTLVDGYQSAGRYSVTLVGTNLSSGVYIYRIQAGNFIATRRLMLVK